jgi:hypothetical protein
MTDDLYREVILDHYRHPRNMGKLEVPGHLCQRREPPLWRCHRADLYRAGWRKSTTLKWRATVVPFPNRPRP